MLKSTSILLALCLSFGLKLFNPSQQEAILTPGTSQVLIFSSKTPPAKQRQTIKLLFPKAGNYSIMLSNDGPPYSDQWLIWDCIILTNTSKTKIWQIGEDETPPDYSKEAFDEFCDTNSRTDCLTIYKVGSTSSQDFSKELNDNSIPELEIKFNVNSSLVNQHLLLNLSTLYSSHTGSDEFRMRVSLKTE